MDENPTPIKHSFDFPLSSERHINWVKVVAVVVGAAVLLVVGVIFGAQYFGQGKNHLDQVTQNQRAESQNIPKSLEIPKDLPPLPPITIEQPEKIESDDPNIDIVKLPGESFYRRYITTTSDSSLQTSPPQTKSDIVWKKLNYVSFNDSSIRYSFKIPDVGPFCEGCFDGWPSNANSVNVEGQSIRGSFFQNDIGGKWHINAGVVYKNIDRDSLDPTYQRYDDEIATMTDSLLQLKENEQTTILNYLNQPVLATRLKDATYNGHAFQLYETEDEEYKYFALLDRGNYVVILIYTFSDPVYDVFNDILNSFSFSLYDDPAYGQLEPLTSV